jgi:hypothetical protein
MNLKEAIEGIRSGVIALLFVVQADRSSASEAFPWRAVLKELTPLNPHCGQRKSAYSSCGSNGSGGTSFN